MSRRRATERCLSHRVGDHDSTGDRSRRSSALPRHALRRAFPTAAAPQGRRLARRDGPRHRPLAPARHRHHRVAAGPVGPDQGCPHRLHRRRTRFPDRPDAPGRALLLRHSARGLPRSGRALADRHCLCGRGLDEQFPAGEHRHVRDADHVRRHHPRRDARGLDRRLSRPKDLLHDRGHLRLPVPLPLRPGLVHREPRQPLRAPPPLDPDRRREPSS